MAAEICRQRRYQTKSTAMNPHNQMAARKDGSACMGLDDTVRVIGAEIAGLVAVVKGCETSCIVKYSPACGPVAARVQASWLPTATSSEKGIRNFSEAASQSE